MAHFCLPLPFFRGGSKNNLHQACADSWQKLVIRHECMFSFFKRTAQIARCHMSMSKSDLSCLFRAWHLCFKIQTSPLSFLASKKPWCSTQESIGNFWSMIGRGRCRLDCGGVNLATDLEANLAKKVNIHKYQPFTYL